jgi:tetratricopeptide (TPR) repeat protein
LKEEALYLYAQGRFAECARTYERLLELNPSEPSLYVGQAEAYRRAGERREALHAYRMAAGFFLDRGDEARARAALKVARELAPRNPEVLRALERLAPKGEEEARPCEPAAPVELFEFSAKREPPARSPSAPRETVPPQAEVRRQSDNTLAMRAAPGMPWWVVSSNTPLLTYEVDDLQHVMGQKHSREVTLQAGA